MPYIFDGIRYMSDDELKDRNCIVEKDKFLSMLQSR